MASESPKRKCLGAGCENDASSLQCPTCLKLSIKDSFFCSQDCFKKNWGEHKALHKSSASTSQSNLLRNLFPPKVVSKPDAATGHFNPFPTFPYTGTLRPVYPLSPKRTIPKRIPLPEWSEDGIPKYRSQPGRTKIEILDDTAQEGMRKVCRLAREVLDIAAAAVRPGVTTDYIDEIVHKACIERDVGYRPMLPTAPPVLLTVLVPVVPFSPQLQPLSQVGLHVAQRSHLPRHPRPARAR
jgi:methionyl aminopeptidase